jgi:hypothetical protein
MTVSPIYDLRFLICDFGLATLDKELDDQRALGSIQNPESKIDN